MRRVLRVCSALVACVVAVVGCGGGSDNAPAVLTAPEVTIDRTEAAVGSPIQTKFRFALLPGASMPADYTVFVHVVDADGELMWTDDHQPPVPTSRWRAGEPQEYTRMSFVPKFPYEGTAFVEVGLYLPSSGERVKMDGEAGNGRAYRVASFNMRLQSDAPFMVFTEGWHDAEGSGERTGVEWQWTRQEGVLAFKNPLRDARLYLEVDQPIAGQGASHVDVRLGEETIDAFDLAGATRILRTIEIARGRFGPGETVTLRITPNATFVPAQVPALQNADTRELGVRVFRVFVQPQ